MLLSWFARKDVDEFADAIVGELLQRFPRSGVDLSTTKSAQRATKDLDRMLSRIGTFAAERRPSLYQKARFGNRIKWALKEAGYPPPFVEVVTHELVAQMALASRSRSPAK